MTRGCREMMAKAFLAVVGSLVFASSTAAQPRPIDTANSTLTVRVFKAGVFSALGHDHEISARIASGSVDVAGHRVQLTAKASSLRVADPHVSEKDRAEIQSTMTGPDVLSVERYPEISFDSTMAEPAGGNSWKVHGNLTLHGVTRPVLVDVHESGGHYVGSSQFKQSEFEMKPIKVAGGTIRVKDEIRVEFDIQLAR